MAWTWLILAGLCEIGWAYGLKLSQGFSRFWPSVWTVVVMLLSVAMLARAMQSLPLGTAYAVWTGIGAIGTAIVGMVLLNEPTHAPRIICIGLIVAGIAGLKWWSPAN
jgi:quaternary ammonium compound-resistance protein SugE